MLFAPTSLIGNLKLVTQYVPNGSRLDTLFERLDHGHVAKPHKHLIPRQRSPIGATQYLIKQLPKFTFPHTATLTERYEKTHRSKAMGPVESIITPHQSRDSRPPYATSAPC